MREPIDWTLPSGVDSSHLYLAESEGSVSLMTREALLSQKSISYLRPRYTSLFSLNQWTSKSLIPGLIAQSSVAVSGAVTTTSLTLLKIRGGSPTEKITHLNSQKLDILFLKPPVSKIGVHFYMLNPSLLNM